MVFYTKKDICYVNLHLKSTPRLREVKEIKAHHETNGQDMTRNSPEKTYIYRLTASICSPNKRKKRFNLINDQIDAN